MPAGSRLLCLHSSPKARVRLVAAAFSGVGSIFDVVSTSASTYWRRRDKIADALGIPVGAQLTPGSLRPGGTIHLNHSGLAIADLMWRLRLRQISTLESYLQETGASNVLASLPLKVKHNVRHCAQMLPHHCKVFIPHSSLA